MLHEGIFLATYNAANVALPVNRKIASSSTTLDDHLCLLFAKCFDLLRSVAISLRTNENSRELDRRL